MVMVKEKVVGLLEEKNAEMSLLRQSIESCRGQIDEVVVVDNSDLPEIKSELRNIEATSGGFVVVLWNQKDIGGAESLNQGARFAMEHGATWVATLCDDTILTPGTVSTMLTAYRALPPASQEVIALITPNLMSVQGLAFPDEEASITEFGGTTECQLVKTALLPTIGFWFGPLFLDCIDGEFCHRVAAHGYQNLFVPRAVVNARWGHPDKRKLFGKSVMVPHYPPYRYYYMSRNLVYLYTRNFWSYITHQQHWDDVIWAVIIPRFFIKLVLFEDHRAPKIRACLRGWRDGILGRLGKMPQ